MATQLVPRPKSCTLYDLEDNLQALVNSVDLAEEPSAREAILEEVGQALRRTVEKRDAVVAFPSSHPGRAAARESINPAVSTG